MRSDRRSICGPVRAILLLLCFVSGCYSRPSTETNVPIQVDGAEAEHDHDHDHEHEHFPTHWPGDIFHASERLDGLLRGKLPGKEGLSALQEMADLLKWLPVLAADSDLSREDFYRIDAWSSEWTKIATQHVEQRGELENFPKVESLQQMVDSLRDVCRKEQDRLRAMQPLEPSAALDSQIGPQ